MVRPFYIKSEISGRETCLKGGCRSKDGSITTKIFQRNAGEIVTPFRVEQNTFYNTKTKVRTLVSVVYDIDNNEIGRYESPF